MIDKNIILDVLKTVNDPELNKDLVSLNMIKDIEINDNDVKVTIELTTPACPLKDVIEKDCISALNKIENIGKIEIEMPSNVTKLSYLSEEKENLIPNIKNVILVGSGKGGVGKSTISVNLAIALSMNGARVGLMDADIYGPSLNLMMGMKDQKVMTEDGKTMIPLEKYGVKFISIGSLVDAGEALIWRGPILEGVLKQFLKDVNWGELDYLVIDLPPGTGDVQLSLGQKINASGAVIVSTPQDLALIDVMRAKTMFDKLSIPILGVIENMSYFACPYCGEKTHVFSNGGTKNMAKDSSLDFLGSLPLDIEIREGGDLGSPFVTEEGDIKNTFIGISRKIAGKISILNHEKNNFVNKAII